MLDGGRKAALEGSSDAKASRNVVSLVDVRRDTHQSGGRGGSIRDQHTDQTSCRHLSRKCLVRPLLRHLPEGSESSRTAALQPQARYAGGEWLYGRIALQQSERLEYP